MKIWCIRSFYVHRITESDLVGTEVSQIFQCLLKSKDYKNLESNKVKTINKQNTKYSK